LAHGVGHILTASVSGGVATFFAACLTNHVSAFSSVVFPALGVGHNPTPVPLVGSANVVRSHNSPSRIIPHFGKVTEDHGKSSLNKQWAVFHEDEARSNFTDNARHLAPQS
jgi:hypothetical protein